MIFKNIIGIEQHLELLEDRGLTFKGDHNKDSFRRLILSVGYYKISQYFKHFYTNRKDKIFSDIHSDSIKKAYSQNERLRRILVSALLQIENFLSTLIVESMNHREGFAYWHYSEQYQDLNLLAPCFQRNSKGAFLNQPVAHFKADYPSHTLLPSWVVLPCHDFGTLCQLIPLLPSQARKEIARKLQLPRKYRSEQIYDVFNGLRYLRNQCVHNKKLLGESIKTAPPLFEGQLDANHLNNCLAWILYFSFSMNGKSSTYNELQEIEKVCLDLPEKLQINVFSSNPLDRK
jgi:abortive infection bacteriophage resistance protein